MTHGKRCLMVHGHFYQPPRENPWTGRIEPQHSAAPWENWNSRIADECYLPMARSRVYNEDGEVVDLYNNYAHTSFNFGPTLLSWLQEIHPAFIRHLRDATAFDRSFAMAQIHNHMIMPLADARHRHTGVLWAMREFRRRFGAAPESMWLPECGIDAETIRALVDHGIRLVILSPHQASRMRPFGENHWHDAAMGAIDTRRAYRLFETDGGGRTHFDRFLDVIFYTPALNLKVSFDHILSRPDDLARELEACYLPEYEGAQLVSIVTDGEIYGHHEKRGEEALSRLYRDIAPALGLEIVSPLGFVRENPPAWEVKLWNGEDGRGSSWSCQHGVGRWYRDCGCRPPSPPEWNQEWRAPFRTAMNAVRDRVRETMRRELGPLVHDVDDAFDDYISVILDTGPASRRAFLDRHCQHPPDLAEIETLWRLLEAGRNAFLAFASCGWFFDELSGLEPVQNMRYALRAMELIQPFTGEDPAALLQDELSRAPSNLRHYSDGAAVFRRLALPGRHSNRELAAAMAVCLAADFPRHSLDWQVVGQTKTVHRQNSGAGGIAWGSFVCHDPRLDRYITTAWIARLDDFDNAVVGLHGYREVQGDPGRETGAVPFAPDEDFSWLKRAETEIRGVRSMRREDLLERLEGIIDVVGHDRLPEAVRAMLYRRFSGPAEAALVADAAVLGKRAVPFLARAHRHGARTPDTIVKTVTCAFERETSQAAFDAVAAMDFGKERSGLVEAAREAARGIGIEPRLDIAYQAFFRTAMELFHWLASLADPGWLAGNRLWELPEGKGGWVCPGAAVNHDLRFPSAGELAPPLGAGLARILGRLAGAEDPGRAALNCIPLPELCEWAERLGFAPHRITALGMAYWDFLDKPLPALITADPVGIMGGVEGDRVRRLGALLGFAPATVEKRIIAAMRSAL